MHHPITPMLLRPSQHFPLSTFPQVWPYIALLLVLLGTILLSRNRPLSVALPYDPSVKPNHHTKPEPNSNPRQENALTTDNIFLLHDPSPSPTPNPGPTSSPHTYLDPSPNNHMSGGGGVDAEGGHADKATVGDPTSRSQTGAATVEPPVGPSKMVVTYTLFGDNPYFLVGLRENVEYVQLAYPNWTVFVYYDSTVPVTVQQYLLETQRRQPDLLRAINMTDHPRYTPLGCTAKTMWRFEPFGDPSVLAFVSRDLDSRLNYREVLPYRIPSVDA